ncbi:hypothetical protein B566_EDAN007980 [Ephemera danica]|nr:hypothetical protein B566_EDAN007980 [Ephemera danica]
MEADNGDETSPANEQSEDIPNDEEESVDFQSPFRRRKVLSRAKNTISAASKLLRQKIPCSGHLMTPRRLWIQSVPTQDCDVVLMFPSGAQDVTLMWLLARLRSGSPGLVVHVRHHSSSDCYGFYLTAQHNVYSACFDGIEDERSFFTTQERGWLVLHLLQTLRAGSGDEVAGVRLIEGQAIVPKCLAAGVISQVFPLHDTESLSWLQRSWVRAFFKRQPLDQICEYFGVKIAMYFAWLGHYTTALIVPAVVGFIFWVFFCGRDQAKEDIGFVIFSLFNVVWATVYLEAWKRYSAELAYRWGTLDQRDELLVEPRPLFTGPLEKSPVTGRLEPYYPAWKRNAFRYLVSVPIIALCLAVVFVVMFLILELQEWWDGKIESRGYPFWLSYLPKILLAVVITLMDEAYHKVALWLNDRENYRLETKYENHLIVKVALFQFVNSFLSLFYIAFYLQDQEKLKEQLAALLIARQVIGNIKESALPYLLEQLRLAKLSFDMFGALSPSEEAKKELGDPPPGDEGKPGDEPEEGQAQNKKQVTNRNVSQAELETTLYKYDGTFEDHLEMFIQFGYVVLFSSAFPMAALCALLNNLIEIRSDAFKLCFIFQRPFGQRVPNIGTWQDAMEVMGLIAVLVNCALIGLSGQVHRMFPEMSTTQTILLIVILEHIMLILRFVISYAIPDLPAWVATEMAKVEFSRREAFRRMSSTAQSPGPDPSIAEADAALVIGRFVVSPATDEEKEATPEAEVPVEDSAPEPVPPSPDKPVAAGSAGDRSPAAERTPESSESSDHDKSPKSALKKSSEWFDEHLDTKKKEIRRDVAFAPLSPHILNHHLTIGPHGGIDWVRRLGLENIVGRKSVNGSHLEIGSLPDARRAGSSGSSEESAAIRHSTDCIVAAKDLSASSDSDLLRSAPPWAQQRSKFRFSPEKDGHLSTPSDSSHVLSSAERVAAAVASSSNPEVRRPSAPSSTTHDKRHSEDVSSRSRAGTDSSSPLSSASGGVRPRVAVALEPGSFMPPIATTSNAPTTPTAPVNPTPEDLAAKKSRVKSSLLKRARSVAIFSLKLKERRARDALAKENKAASPAASKPPPIPSQHWTGRNPDRVEGELSCIPIEKLISVDDVAVELMRKRTNT